MVEALARATDIMRFHHLAYVCLAATLGGCVVPQDLGDTASGSSTGANSEGLPGVTDWTLSEGPSGSVTGLDSDSMSGPSSMSGVSLTGTGVTLTGTGMATAADTDTDPGSTGEGGMLCDEAESPVAWAGGGFDLLTAVAANQRFVGVGRCTATEDGANTMSLTCTMDGTRDATPFEQQTFTFPITLQSAIPSAELWSTITLADFGARLVVESGFEIGAERWFVADSVFSPDEGVMPGVILTDGFRVAPPSDMFSEWYDGSWFDGPDFSITEATCGFVDPECGAEQRALEALWTEFVPLVGHTDEYFEFPSPFEETWLGVWPGPLWEVPEPMCLDYPTSNYQFVAVAQTP